MMLYQWHEMTRNWMAPWIHQAEANAKIFSDPDSWLSTLTGADRIAANFDTANKIGTYSVSILAREHGLPFYVAAPQSTFDPATPDGHAIVIEERGRQEVLGFGRERTAPDVKVFNPAFDVTPAANITAFITETGLIKP